MYFPIGDMRQAWVRRGAAAARETTTCRSRYNFSPEPKIVRGISFKGTTASDIIVMTNCGAARRLAMRIPPGFVGRGRSDIGRGRRDKGSRVRGLAARVHHPLVIPGPFCWRSSSDDEILHCEIHSKCPNSNHVSAGGNTLQLCGFVRILRGSERVMGSVGD